MVLLVLDRSHYSSAVERNLGPSSRPSFTQPTVSRIFLDTIKVFGIYLYIEASVYCFTK